MPDRDSARITINQIYAYGIHIHVSHNSVISMQKQSQNRKYNNSTDHE